MRISSLRVFLLPSLLAISFLATSAQKPFCDKSRSARLIDIELHALVGGSAITQNYMSCFAEIRQLNNAMGCAAGGGAVAEMVFRDYIALGTQINFLTSNSRTDMAVSNEHATSISNVFLHNRQFYFNFPVYLSFRFNVADNLKWHVDAGGYYSYGVGGYQNQAMYSSMVNDLGQLVNRVVNNRPAIFNNSETFVNKFSRGDLGFHVSTGLIFARHYHVGVTSDLGIKNISYTDGLVNPNLHNITIMFKAGYRF